MTLDDDVFESGIAGLVHIEIDANARIDVITRSLKNEIMNLYSCGVVSVKTSAVPAINDSLSGAV